MTPEQTERGTVLLLVKLLAWVVLGLMSAATVYTAWIALANFNQIGV
jgi:hypothetical protein